MPRSAPRRWAGTSRYAVQLPPSYAAGDRRYPVAPRPARPLREPGLLGAAGPARASSRSCWRSGEVPEMIVVAADGDNSFFVNGPLGAYEDLVTRDLPAHVEASLPRRSRPRGPRAARASPWAATPRCASRCRGPRPSAPWPRTARWCWRPSPPPPQAPGAGTWPPSTAPSAIPSTPALWAAADPLAWAARADPAQDAGPLLRLRILRPLRPLQGQRGAAPPPPGPRRGPRVRPAARRPRLRLRALGAGLQPAVPRRRPARPLGPGGRFVTSLA